MNNSLRDPDVSVLHEGERKRVRYKGDAQYWTRLGDQVLISRALGPLVSRLPSPQLSPASLAAYAQGFGGTWVTPFEGVHRLTFGHELVAEPSGPRITRWLTPRPWRPADGSPAEALRSAVTAAVEESLAGETEVTLAVSGGLDSTVVAAVAASLVPDPEKLVGYCASPREEPPRGRAGRMYDEWELAAPAARRAGISPVRLQNGDGVDWLDLAPEIHERLLLPTPAPANAWWLRGVEMAARAAAHRMILTGQSGNATFSGGPAVLPRRGGIRKPLAAARRGLTRRGSGDLPSPHRRGATPVLPDHVRDDDLWTRWCLAEPNVPGKGPWTGSDVSWRDPLGSPEVVSLAWGLPREAWTDDRGPRALARSVGRGLIPETVRLNTARGVQVADQAAMIHRRAAQYRAAVDTVCRSNSAASFLDLDVLADSVGLFDSVQSAERWRRTYLRALTVGLFAAWWDQRNTGAG